MLGIEIVCDHATRLYTLNFLDDVTASGVRQMLLDSLALNNTVNLAGELRERIVFEQPPAGIRYISTIVAAMREERQLRVTYRRFDARESHSFLLAPYCLKIFKQRWYLVGKPEDHPEETDPKFYDMDGELFTIPAGKCWMTVPAGNNAPSIRLVMGAPTGLKAASYLHDEQIYNILGQPVSQPQPGQVYILNGQKFIQK